MAASVRVEAQALSDPRFGILGELITEAIREPIRLPITQARWLGHGLMIQVWSYCTDRNREILTALELRHLTGQDGVGEAMVQADLAEGCDDGFRIKGTAGRIEWLEKKRKASKKGGEARKTSAKPNGYPSGKPNGLVVASEIGTPIATAIATTTAIANNPPKPPRGGSRSKKSGPSGSEVSHAAGKVIDAFNRCFNRSLGATGFEDQVKRLLAKGYTEAEMRGVVWWAGEKWADDPDWRMRITPTTLLKLSSSHGNRTFPQYLELASERWRSSYNGETPPWERRQDG